MTDPAHSVENERSPTQQLKIFAVLPANVELATFQGRTAVRFRDPISREMGLLEEFGSSLTAVAAAQAGANSQSCHERVLLVPEERRWVYVSELPEHLKDAEKVIQTALHKLCVIPENGSSSIDTTLLIPDACMELTRRENALLRRHGGDCIPECTVIYGNQEISRVRGTFRPKPNRTNLLETEERFEGLVSGFRGPQREAHLTLMKEGSMKETHRKAHWVDDALGDKIASLATLPSRTNEIRVAGIFGVTMDLKGNSLREIKAIWRK